MHEDQQRQQPNGPDQPAFSPLPPQADGNSRAGLKHSGPGIASFVVSLIMTLLSIVLFLVMTVMVAAQFQDIEQFNPENIADLEGDLAVLGLIGLGFLGALVGNIVALVLGIIGLTQKERKKGFAVAGTVISGLYLGFGLLLFLLSSMLAAV